MKSFPSKPGLYLVQGSELLLTGKALLELMTAVLAKGRPFRFRARGWSMAPFIRDGDIITVAPFQAKPPEQGEVVAYIRPGYETLVIHRLVGRRVRRLYATAAGRKADDWLILGDNTPDDVGEYIPIKNLVGRVTNIERDGQKVWLGLGPERAVIALFSRKGYLLPVIARLRLVYKGFLRRVSK